MLKIIRENPELVKSNISNKNEKVSIDPILFLDEKRRTIIQEAEKLKNQRNVVSQEIAVLKRNKENADGMIANMKEVSNQIKVYDDELRDLEDELNQLVLAIPNLLHNSVPVGKSAEENPEVRRWGTLKEKTIDHLEISKKYDLFDFERGAKVSGSGFLFYKNKGAALERALINFMLDFHITKHNYIEIMPPYIVNSESMVGTGQLPKLEDDMYYIGEDKLFLIPTAEVPITNYYSQQVLNIEELTAKFCGYSSCFRREAGSYGKDTRGLLRLHQFNKVELVKFSIPENSYDELESLVIDVEDILQALEIPYRVILLCSGDTSFASAKTYDIEVWSPGEDKWLEVSSCSNFESFQAMRANIRFKRTPSSKPEFLHTLNGSGLATPRLMVAILENYIQSDGRIKVPECLRSYCKFDYI